MVAALIGGVASIAGSAMAASAQKKAAKDANATQMAMYEQSRKDLAPFREVGQTGIDQLNAQKDYLFNPITMDQATLEQTPGYQFNLTQGLKAAQNSAAARGLGSSGAALKGAATYATGLADSTYQNQFNNAITNQSNLYNRIMGTVQTGANAAAGTAQAALTTGQGVAQTTASAGNAQAGAIMNGVNSFNNVLGNYQTMQGYNTGMYGPSNSGASRTWAGR